MSNKVTISVNAPSAHPNEIEVTDALRHIVDAFELLALASNDARLFWKIVEIGMHSPVTATCEAISLEKGVDVGALVAASEKAFSETLDELSAGRRPAKMPSGWKKDQVKNFLERNKNGVGRTDIKLSTRTAILRITPQIAEISIRALGVEEAFIAKIVAEGPKRARGSVEGQIVDVTTRYNKPALKIKERRSGNIIWCVISKEIKDRISKDHSWEEVWEHARVRARGWLYYNQEGLVDHVEAESFDLISPKKMSHADIRDKEFTGGLTPAEYLEKLREGDI